MKNRESLIKKINALLAKTTKNGASKEEMNTSLKKANELMLEYFITENDLKEDNLSDKCTSVEVEIPQTSYDLKIFYPFLSRLFDCKYFYDKYRVVFFGFSQDVRLCEYFHNLIIDCCFSETEKYKKSEEYAYLKKIYHGRTLVSGFIKGFQIAISAKMNDMFKERQSNIPQTFALAVIEKSDKVDAEFDLQFSKLNIKTARTNISGERFSMSSGVQKGEKVNLSGSLSENETDKKPIFLLN